MRNFKFRCIYIASMLSFPIFHLAYAENTLNQSKVIVKYDVKHDISAPLSQLAILKEHQNILRQFKVIPIYHPPLSINQKRIVPDGALDISPEIHVKSMLNSYLGIGVGLGNYKPYFTPPDTNGSAGLTQYVQWVNADFGVFDKSTGQILSGYPMHGNTLWKGFGGVCETTNNGDGVVKYDQLANRWVITQFAFTDSNTGPFFQCVAVSTSSDATGSYYRYAFQFDSFNDYGKLGLWPDAYYMSFNMFGPQSTGPRVCALDRNAMLTGASAQMQCVQSSWNVSGTLLPADLDGQKTPPVGNPEYFMSFAAPNLLQLFKFHVDFNNPNNTHFMGPTNIQVANFSISCPNTAGDGCAPQPNTTTQLDTLSDRLMHRLAYRQFDTYASMVATHTVQANVPAAIRWYELRFASCSTTPTVYQQATRSPDAASRYMGSIAVDKLGNIAVGYTLSSTSDYPTVSFASRNASDPLNTLNSSQRIFTGAGSQVNNLTRWGDYSGMSIDPVDDCTFWYTNEYLSYTGSFNWSTRIGNFKLAGC